MKAMRCWCRAVLALLALTVAGDALAVFTGTATISNPAPQPGDTVSVTFFFTESDDVVAPFSIYSASTGTIVEASVLPPIGGPIATVKPTIPPGAVPPISGAGPLNQVFVETGITIPATLPPGTYAFIRDWSGPSSNINGGNGAYAVFTIAAEPAALDDPLLGVTGSVSPPRLDADGGLVQVRWTLSLDPALAAPVAIDSGRGELDGRGIAGGLNLANALGTVVLNETLRIPADAVQAALARGRGQLEYRRSFRANGQQVGGRVVIDLDHARLAQVSASVSTPLLNAASNGNAVINWQARFDRVGRGGTVQVASARGEFLLPDGSVLGRQSSPLRQSSNAPVAMLTEVVTIDRQVLLRALRAGSDRLLYRRSFDDGQRQLAATASFRILAAGAGGELFIPYQAIFFEDGTVQKVVDAGGELRAVAELTTSGFGRIEGTWEVATPPSTFGEPLFTTLSLVQENLAGSQVHRLLSPALPTDDRGTYLVRFRLRNAEVDPPRILYAVAARGTASPPLTILAPPAGVPMTEDLAFRWRGVPEAENYLLEILPYPRGRLSGWPAPGEDACKDLDAEERRARPLTGLFVPGDSTDTTLTALALSRVESAVAAGQSGLLCWRVAALNAQGLRIGEAELQTIYLPAAGPGHVLNTGQGFDFCEAEGWYDDGVCDADCPKPDPDCAGAPPASAPAPDFCEAEGWYDDGVCDADCPKPDPDCAGTPPDSTPAPDFCEAEGWYDDGVCDADCPNPDPDCPPAAPGEASLAPGILPGDTFPVTARVLEAPQLQPLPGSARQAAACLTDADCTDPSRPSCQSGRCLAIPAGCSSDADCTDPASPTCLGGQCGAMPAACSSDLDCTDPAKPVCAGGLCGPRPAACLTDADCTDPSRPDCTAGQCMATPAGCSSDADCTDPASPKCLGGQCGAMPAACSSDLDCTDPAKPVCAGGLCGARPAACLTDADCTDPSRPNCTAGQCMATPAGCSSDADCTDPAKPVCAGGQCGAPPAACFTDADCTDPSRPSCTAGRCMAIPAGCSSDADCSDPAKPVCNGGQCGAPPATCRGHADCTDPARPLCDQGQCKALPRVQTAPGSPSGSIPGSAGGSQGTPGEVVVPPFREDVELSVAPLVFHGRGLPGDPGIQVPPTRTDGELSIGALVFHGRPLPAGSGDIVVPPTGEHGEIAVAPLVFHGRPAQPPSASDVVVPPTGIDGELAVDPLVFHGRPAVAACLTDADCTDPSRPDCTAGQCRAIPAGCSSDADCTDPAKPICLNGQCGVVPVACSSDLDCTDPGKPVCAGGLCGARPAACLTDADCTDPSRPDCTAGRCMATPAGCSSDADCTDPAKPKCLGGQCGAVPAACSSDLDCTDPGLPTCLGGRCSAGPAS